MSICFRFSVDVSKVGEGGRGVKRNTFFETNQHSEQECIPVGCVPPTALAVSLAMHASSCHMPPCHAHTHVDRQTPVKTLASQTSFAGGNKLNLMWGGEGKTIHLSWMFMSLCFTFSPPRTPLHWRNSNRETSSYVFLNS